MHTNVAAPEDGRTPAFSAGPSVGRFLQGHPNEIAQLDELRFGLALRGEFVERIINGERLTQRMD